MAEKQQDVASARIALLVVPALCKGLCSVLKMRQRCKDISRFISQCSRLSCAGTLPLTEVACLWTPLHRHLLIIEIDISHSCHWAPGVVLCVFLPSIQCNIYRPERCEALPVYEVSTYHEACMPLYALLTLSPVLYHKHSKSFRCMISGSPSELLLPRRQVTSCTSYCSSKHAQAICLPSAVT